MHNQQLALITPPKIELKNLKNLFLQLSSKSCNLKCKNCYIERNLYKNEDDFMDINKIKQCLMHAKNEKLNSIYLTGGEPLIHPDFNNILRMCLKIANTTILTNGVMINDKKVRFLKKIDDESQFETIYRISLDSTDEIENDTLRGRGSFRKAVCAVLSLLKYEFNPIVTVINYNNRKKEDIFQEFQQFFRKRGFEIEEINLKIIPYFPKNLEQFEFTENFNINNYSNLDCTTSRIVCQNGVFSCPVLVNDYRARLGSSLNDCSKFTYLDCEKCSVCLKTNTKNQVNDWM